ncbi:hypothetical protein [Microvirga arabica]|uniref:hypothetical protein n=1 Tax=Microvirga arabica TaxID=1128671 RepID=UPI00193A6531|nr:hypothetical protein [Microvirga arabica]MBM1175549.1 hypothetical protein [Microvirga arabica]
MAGREPAPYALPRLMSIPSTAQMLGTGTTLLFHLIMSHHIATVRLGRRTLVPIEKVERIFASAGSEKAAS